MIHSAFTNWQSPYLRVLNDDQIFEIRQAAFAILEQAGCKIMHEGARKMLADAGAVVNGEIVKLPRHIAEQCLATCPKGFRIYDRDGKNYLEVEGSKSFYGTATASPNTQDALTGEIHETRVVDIEYGAKVADACENIDWVMPFGSSQDVPAVAADLYEFEAVVKNTTKPIVFCGYSSRGVELVYQMAAEVAGGMDNLRAKPFLVGYPEPITPLTYPAEVVERMLVTAEAGQPQIPCGAQQPGATSPITLAGTIAQATAENLMSIVIIQLKRQGAPVFMGCNIGGCNMDTGLMSMVPPEASLGLSAQTQVARSFGLPSWGLAGATDSKLIDAQAGAEAALSLLAQGMAGLNFIHDSGYIDMGMICSTEMLVLSNELIGWVKRFMDGIQVNRDTLATEIIEQVGPGGNYLATRHTLERFRKEYWRPKLFTRKAYATWKSEGGSDMRDRLHAAVKEIIDTHEVEQLPDKTLTAIAELRSEGEKELVAKAD